MKRTFIIELTVEGEPDDNDALVADIAEACSGMATWVEAAMGDVSDVTVWADLEDFIKDKA